MGWVCVVGLWSQDEMWMAAYLESGNEVGLALG